MEDVVNICLTIAIMDTSVIVQLEHGVKDARKISMNATITLA